MASQSLSTSTWKNYCFCSSVIMIKCLENSCVWPKNSDPVYAPAPQPFSGAFLDTYLNIYLDILYEANIKPLFFYAESELFFLLLKLKVFISANYLSMDFYNSFNVGSVSRAFSIIAWKPLLSVDLSPQILTCQKMIPLDFDSEPVLKVTKNISDQIQCRKFEC